MSAADFPLGLRFGLDAEHYHAMPGVSNSGLRDFARSPLHYYSLHLDLNRPTPAEKAGQLEGTLAHCAILEPGQFDARYAVGPDVSRATKEWKAWEASETRQAIKPQQSAVARSQARSVRLLPDVAALLSVGQPEVSAFWIDEATGEPCRCRPDWVRPVADGRGVILLDVKTCSDADPEEFARQVARKGYHRQAAWYTDGYQAASGQPVLGFVFVAVEDAWPFAASAVMLDDEGLQRGREQNRALMESFAECRRTNVWPGYGSAIVPITLPAWA